MLKKRGYVEIIGQILECLSDTPLKKTHVTFKCNLDSRTAGKYIQLMESLDLITYSKDMQLYMINSRGRKYLKKFHNFVELFDNQKSEFIQYHEPNLVY